MRFIPSAVTAALTLLGWALYSRFQKRLAVAEAAQQPLKLLRRYKKLSLAFFIFSGWLLLSCVLMLFFGDNHHETFTVNVIPPRSQINLFGYYPSETMLVGWGIMAVIILAAVALNRFFIPKLSDHPGKFQNALETLVEAVEGYTSERTSNLGRPMYGYVFAIGACLVGNAIAELMGFRSPSSDLMFTVALSLFSFLMANWYGIRKLTMKGRLKGLMHPSPLLLPIRLVTDLANPLSMACRLFGNTISGMIVMNLIYSVLGSFGSFIPSIIGLYFNVFTALIQTIIFITLTLSNINDATTAPEA